MKLLIVDDEQHVIKAIKFLIDATKMHITTILEASGVQEAISVINAENPELIITDVVMDDFTGIDLMEYMRSAENPAKVIVVSGYNEYGYIRSALQNGGIDYILKPIDGSQLNAALERAIDAYNKDRQNQLKNLQILDNMCDICKESLLYKLITQPMQDKSYEDLLSIVPELAKEHTAVLGYSTIKYLESGRGGGIHRIFKELSVELNKRLEKLGGGFCFFPPDTDYEFYVFLYRDHEERKGQMRGILDAFRGKACVPFAVGLSQPCAFPEKAHLIKDQAEQAFLSQNMSDPSDAVLQYNPEVEGPPLAALAREYNRLFSALITGNEPLIDQSIDGLVKKAFPHGSSSIQYFVEFAEDYNRMMRQWNRQLNEYYTHIQFTECERLKCTRLLDGEYKLSLEAVRRCVGENVRHFLGQLTAKNAQQENNIIYQISHYLELNYMQPFNQSECAKLFFINKDYMCRKFKSTFHINMVSYVTQLRINRAKELLAASEMKIRDIAQAVGFEDEKYFSRRFTKEVGMSPNEYRGKRAEEG